MSQQFCATAFGGSRYNGQTVVQTISFATHDSIREGDNYADREHQISARSSGYCIKQQYRLACSGARTLQPGETGLGLDGFFIKHKMHNNTEFQDQTNWFHIDAT